MGEACSTHVIGKECVPFFSGKLERKRPRERPGHSWESNIRTDFREILWKVLDWVHLNEDKDQWQVFVNKAMNLRIPRKARNFLTS
jgi:hypothetical protein